LTPEQAENIFRHLDQNQDGKLDYREFCNLAVEEKRRKIDPFDSHHKKHHNESETKDELSP
jgi:hypothetical protein